MIYQKITHTVEDFASWKTGFVGNADFRKSHSCKAARVYTEPTNKNRISVIMEWSDKEKMEVFASSPQLKEAMKHSGVTSPPDVVFQENDFNTSELELQFELDG